MSAKTLDYESMTVPELRELAGQRGISGAGGMNKADVIVALKADDAKGDKPGDAKASAAKSHAKSFVVLMTHSTCPTSTLDVPADTEEDALAAALAEYPGSTATIIGEIIEPKSKADIGDAEDIIFTCHAAAKTGEVRTLAVTAKTPETAKAMVESAYPSRSAIVTVEEVKK